jgi:hypothetical protein
VPLPDQGDPEPVCLNPPCRPAGTAIDVDLAVILTGAPAGTRMRGEVSGLRGREYCSATAGELCQFDAARTDGPLELSVHANRCATVTQTVTVHPGKNTVTVPCHRLRTVQGLFRSASGVPPDSITIRCGDSEERARAFLFSIECLADETELTYQVKGQPPRRAAIPAHGDPVVVELML